MLPVPSPKSKPALLFTQQTFAGNHRIGRAAVAMRRRNQVVYRSDLHCRTRRCASLKRPRKPTAGWMPSSTSDDLHPRKWPASAANAASKTLVSAKLTPLAHLTRVTANRMRVVLNQGLILNVMTMPHPRNGRETAIAGYARTAIAAMTKSEAQAWAARRHSHQRRWPARGCLARNAAKAHA